MTDQAAPTPPPAAPMSPPPPAREKVGFLLGVGIFFIPIVFAWFTLKAGYSTLARVISFIWLGLGVLFWIGTIAGHPTPGGHQLAADSTDAGGGGAASGPAVHNVGDAMTNDDGLQMGVTSVKEQQAVGQLSPQQAAEGGAFVVVRYVLTNTSNKPIKSFDLPREIKLIDPAGTVYSPDSGATGSLTFGDESVNEKLWSDLNPGITVRGAEVFEVSKAAYDAKTWRIRFGDDGPIVAIGH